MYLNIEKSESTHKISFRKILTSDMFSFNCTLLRLERVWLPKLIRKKLKIVFSNYLKENYLQHCMMALNLNQGNNYNVIS